MNRTGRALSIGFFLGVATCIAAVSLRLRFSLNADAWAIRLLLFPCVMAIVLSVAANMISHTLLKADLRSLQFRGVDVALELKRIAEDGPPLHKRLVTVFYWARTLASMLMGYFVNSIFLAPYLIFR